MSISDKISINASKLVTRTEEASSKHMDTCTKDLVTCETSVSQVSNQRVEQQCTSLYETEECCKHICYSLKHEVVCI